jgi:endo-1,3(4)-beta-glucanase
MKQKNKYWFRWHLLVIVVIIAGAVFWRMTPHDDTVISDIGKNPTADPIEKNETKQRSVVMKTNSWFSSVYKKFPTAPMFVLPGSYRFDEKGLSFGIPSVSATENAVFGSFDPLCSVGMRSEATGIDIDRYGDWDASFSVRSGVSPWRVHLSQGSPIVSIHAFDGPMILSCADGVERSSIENGVVLKRGQSVVIVQGRGAFSLGSDGLSSDTAELLSSEKAYRIILVPQETDQPLSFFAELPWNRILDTRVEYRHADGKIFADYSFSRENDEIVLTTLWPHHRSGMGADMIDALGTYRTSIGDFRLVRTKGFSVAYDDPDFSFSFDPVSDPSAKAKIGEMIREDVKRLSTETPPGGVYFRGTWLGGLASVAQLADTYGMKSEKDALLDILEKETLSSLGNFTYDEKLSILAAKNDEFGNKEGNDHHFHYGYYLRASAVLVSLRPELRPKVEQIMNELALDIANTDRTSTRYPYVRNFAPYDGHSWADGFALFNDGNNQESTSEALNAWYGVWMWGEVTGNDTFKKTGVELFAVELAGTKAYWFGKDNPFPAGYAHAMASLVWGGKRDFATWFSGDPMHIHGIQWLPITPASRYLSTLPNTGERVAEVLRTHPNPTMHEWGDLYLAYRSYTDPWAVVGSLAAVSDKVAIKSRALLYQTTYRNIEISRNGGR